MAIISVRLDEASAPSRHDDFEAALSVGGGTPTNVIRALVDAYVRFVRENGRVPTLPCKIAEIEKKKKG